MKTGRVLYHLARADFLERVRRYSFLLILAGTIFLGYAINRGDFYLQLDGYRGILNSAWVGSMMAATTILILSLFGFYLVKNAIERDSRTGVGQIIATTPISRPAYLLGKWLSNWVVLAALVGILAAAAILMQLFGGEAQDLDIFKLLSPFLLLVLPAMAVVAAIAVLFETIPWLKGGFGNVAYFFLWTFVLVAVFESKTIWLDWTGMKAVNASMGADLKAVYPAYSGGFDFTGQALPQGGLHTFDFQGIRWTFEILASRLVWLVAAAGVALSGSLFFQRFDPSFEKVGRKRKAVEPVLLETGTVSTVAQASDMRLTPLARQTGRARFSAVFIAELRMFLKGQPWWWYAVAGGLVLAQLFNPPEVSRILLVVAWAWPVLLLGGLGCREARFDTHQLVFSAPHPLRSQLPATWLSAFFVTALLGAGTFIRFLAAADWTGLMAWQAGALFIPSLSLILGVLTGGSKTFEVVYVLWMYLIVQRGAPGIDFVGLAPASPWQLFAALAVLLTGLAFAARRWQLQRG